MTVNGLTYLGFFCKMSNASSNASSIKGLNIIAGLFVFVTNMKAVQAVGPVRHKKMVSRATVGFRQLCVMIADSVTQCHVERRELMASS
jgi:hypothetical protein